MTPSSKIAFIKKIITSRVVYAIICTYISITLGGKAVIVSVFTEEGNQGTKSLHDFFQYHVVNNIAKLKTRLSGLSFETKKKHIPISHWLFQVYLMYFVLIFLK